MNVSDKKAENATSWEERPSRAGEEEELACDDMANGGDGSASMSVRDYQGRKK